MNPSELPDRELDEMLKEWRAPQAPAHLRASVFPQSRAPWWRRSIPVPLPVACALVILMATGAWRLLTVDSGRSELQPVSELRPVIIRGQHVPN